MWEGLHAATRDSEAARKLSSTRGICGGGTTGRCKAIDARTRARCACPHRLPVPKFLPSLSRNKEPWACCKAHGGIAGSSRTVVAHSQVPRRVLRAPLAALHRSRGCVDKRWVDNRQTSAESGLEWQALGNSSGTGHRTGSRALPAARRAPRKNCLCGLILD